MKIEINHLFSESSFPLYLPDNKIKAYILLAGQIITTKKLAKSF